MKRNLASATIGLLVTVLVGCSGDEAPVATAPEVYVADVIQKDVPIIRSNRGNTWVRSAGAMTLYMEVRSRVSP